MAPNKLILIISIISNILFAQRKSSPETFTTKNKKAIELYKQGENYLAQRLVVEAEHLLKQAIKKDEKFAEPYFLLAQLNKYNYDLQAAKNYFETGLTLQPDNPKFSIFYYDVAEIYLREGNYDDAFKNANK
ncbi:MAG TPA: tetratricopeptide repeat protein, partial [Cytophagales bacterium]|nr:tetratricopeptide repeat protein [Cytophagales bacterium]